MLRQPPRSNGVWAALQTWRLLMRLSIVSFANMACSSFLTKPQRFPKCIECWPIEVGQLSASGVQSSIAPGKRRSLMQLSVMWEVNRLRKIRSAFSFGDADQLQQVIVAAGFRGVKIRIDRETIRHASIAEYVPGYISATPVAAAVAGLEKEAQAKITADVRDALAAYRVGDGLAAPIEAYVAIGDR